MNNKETIEKIQISENTEDLSSLIDELFSETIADENVVINLLIEDIQNTIEGYSPVKNYGFTPKAIQIKGNTHKLTQVINNLRFSVEKLKSILKQKSVPIVRLKFNEADLPEFLSDEQLMELLSYTKATVSTKRSRGKLPQKNDLGFTAKADLFKMLRDNTNGYLSADERVEQKIRNRKRKNKN